MADEIQHLLLNAELRDALEPYLDESVHRVNVSQMPTQMENEFLSSMLAWERAPALPIAEWFSPRLELAPPESVSDDALESLLENAIEQLYSKKIVLRCTDHLSDRELYTIIYRDILPTCEKKVEVPGKVLEWLCVEDTETWLRYYADAVERRRYQEEHDVDLPACETPPYQRKLPGN